MWWHVTSLRPLVGAASAGAAAGAAASSALAAGSASDAADPEYPSAPREATAAAGLPDGCPMPALPLRRNITVRQG